MERERLAVTLESVAAKTRAERVFLAAGLIRSSDSIGRWAYRSGPLWRGRARIIITLTDDAHAVADACEARGIAIPMRPTMEIPYEAAQSL